MNTLIVAPHADDETFGCGGAILRWRNDGVRVGWLLVTEPNEAIGWSKERIEERELEVALVRKMFNIPENDFFRFGFNSATLDQVSRAELVARFDSVFKTFRAERILLPHPNDAHSDHEITFAAALGAAKWFRSQTIKSILTYEVCSETDFGLNPSKNKFSPNLYVDVSEFIDKKIEIASFYKGELGVHPFPRSVESIYSYAKIRGAQVGVAHAEAFQILKELI